MRQVFYTPYWDIWFVAFKAALEMCRCILVKLMHKTISREDSALLLLYY